MALTNAFPVGTALTDAQLNQGVALGARYAQKGSAQSVPNAADTKMKFETVVHSNTDVIASGTNNTDFALQRTGFWLIDGGARFMSSAGSGERHFFLQTGSAFAIANRMSQANYGNVGSTLVTVSTATVIKVTAAPLTIIAGLFQNSGGALSLDVAFGEICHIGFTWLGPA